MPWVAKGAYEKEHTSSVHGTMSAWTLISVGERVNANDTGTDGLQAIGASQNGHPRIAGVGQGSYGGPGHGQPRQVRALAKPVRITVSDWTAFSTGPAELYIVRPRRTE